MSQLRDLDILSLAFCEFVEANHRKEYMCTNQCTLMFDTVGDQPVFVLRGVDSMKTNFGDMPSFDFDGVDKLIYKEDRSRVILVVFE